MRLYKQSSRRKDVLSTASIDRTANVHAWKKCRKTICTSLPKDEHLDVQNMLNTL